ncbi:MAG TPA: hypothetical protein VMU99_06715 [Acidimicrobiales bacterium]|nr:hypothetical protein [Acidimicrobiales bacterium]
MPLTLDDYVVEVPERPVWYKRTSTLIVLAVAVVIAASVLVDLPSKITLGADASAQTKIMDEINNDLAGCAYATIESFTIYRDLQAKTLTAQNRSQAPSMLRDDQIACSLTSSSIYDLSNIQPTGSPAGHRVSDIARIGILWAASDAQSAIIDIQKIFSGTATPSIFHGLANAENQLQRDRSSAFADIAAAERDVHGKLPTPNLPRLTRLSGI